MARMPGQFRGRFEADETFVCGKAKNVHADKRAKLKTDTHAGSQYPESVVEYHLELCQQAGFTIKTTIDIQSITAVGGVEREEHRQVRHSGSLGQGARNFRNSHGPESMVSLDRPHEDSPPFGTPHVFAAPSCPPDVNGCDEPADQFADRADVRNRHVASRQREHRGNDDQREQQRLNQGGSDREDNSGRALVSRRDPGTAVPEGKHEPHACNEPEPDLCEEVKFPEGIRQQVPEQHDNSRHAGTDYCAGQDGAPAEYYHHVVFHFPSAALVISAFARVADQRFQGCPSPTPIGVPGAVSSSTCSTRATFAPFFPSVGCTRYRRPQPQRTSGAIMVEPMSGRSLSQTHSHAALFPMAIAVSRRWSRTS